MTFACASVPSSRLRVANESLRESCRLHRSGGNSTDEVQDIEEAPRSMRRFFLVALCVAATFTGSADASRSIIGGSPISITQAPWTVYLFQASGTCSGAILDATHVVTAGHCVFDANGVAIVPSALTVYAGISEAQGQLGAGGDTAWQMSTASAIRLHPGYSYSENANPDDVAVVALSTPLTLGGSVQAVSLPAAGSPYPASASAVDAGFGLARIHRSGRWVS
jgi:secreted trypsin-like serine protease